MTPYALLMGPLGATKVFSDLKIFAVSSGNNDVLGDVHACLRVFVKVALSALRKFFPTPTFSWSQTEANNI